MAKIRLTIQGKLGEISVASFLKVIEDSLWVFRDLDRGVSEDRRGTLHWVISGLGEGSTYVDIESRIGWGEQDFSRPVANHFIRGLHIIQQEGVTPPLFSVDTMKRVRDIVRQLGRDGVLGVEYTIPDLQEWIELTAATEKTIESLVGVHHRSVGSLEGKIELVSTHTPYRRFNLYHAVTNRAIKCNLPQEMEAGVIEVMKQKRRVVVSGIIAHNAKGEPISIEVKRPLRFLKREEELPSPRDILGMDRDFTGSLSTEEYLRSLHGA